MDEKTFPYRLDVRTRNVLAGLVLTMIDGNATLQSSLATPMTILFSNKENGVPMDAQVYTTPNGIALIYRLNNVAKAHQPTMEWLRRYNAFVSKRLKASAVPAAERCTVMVEATYTGQMQYFFTYMMRYEDDSLAQDMPQGLLVATEPLLLAREQQAAPAMRAKPAQVNQPEEASWV